MSTESSERLSDAARETLIRVARDSIRCGLEQGRSLPVVAQDYPLELQAERASFVTLNRSGLLRGCIGHLEAQLPLVEDVAENAFSAAFRDPRFPPLSELEVEDLQLHISVLTPAKPIEFDSEVDLLRQIRPGIDGLILVDGYAKGTFLPSVWESLPLAEDFLRHLKHKAGLPANHWSESLQVYRYETESFTR
ncbi:MAG: AmmeMemoRadiSam system protein A [Gammaproteobacteria bacterium]|nr:AmmeMemoRadiSam system protein A [Gammaproteobacteria bacterium]